jgi:hypothetical protein
MMEQYGIVVVRDSALTDGLKMVSLMNAKKLNEGNPLYF